MNIIYQEIDSSIEDTIVTQYGSWVRDYKCLVKGEGCYSIAAINTTNGTVAGFASSSPNCSQGAIDAEGLNKYIRAYTKYFPLAEYDIKAMPYVLYFWHCVCNYRPDELACIAEKYQPIATLIQKLLNWLYVHVEELSENLLILFAKLGEKHESRLTT